ncbi:hypothetical protein L1987_55250 [Smallanthus sonchifolius]|uniref:Uncharacterized protein n=1 Tax=Smallanthus sonchifolius TaxID=185202 RepID=A0ACB9E966_9ASTR|nr:hypothetical protein L1987_55250 [Smallanthus sonchifolius]
MQVAAGDGGGSRWRVAIGSNEARHPRRVAMAVHGGKRQRPAVTKEGVVAVTGAHGGSDDDYGGARGGR